MMAARGVNKDRVRMWTTGDVIHSGKAGLLFTGRPPLSRGTPDIVWRAPKVKDVVIDDVLDLPTPCEETHEEVIELVSPALEEEEEIEFVMEPTSEDEDFNDISTFTPVLHVPVNKVDAYSGGHWSYWDLVRRDMEQNARMTPRIYGSLKQIRLVLDRLPIAFYYNRRLAESDRVDYYADRMALCGCITKVLSDRGYFPGRELIDFWWGEESPPNTLGNPSDLYCGRTDYEYLSAQLRFLDRDYADGPHGSFSREQEDRLCVP